MHLCLILLDAMINSNDSYYCVQNWKKPALNQSMTVIQHGLSVFKSNFLGINEHVIDAYKTTMLNKSIYVQCYPNGVYPISGTKWQVLHNALL